MPLIAAVSPKITTRFLEVQESLSLIRSLESPPPSRDSEQVRILRGLFYVHLYGAFEFATTQIIFAITQSFNDAQLTHIEVADPLGAVVLDGHFKAIRDSGFSNQFSKRLKLISQRRSGEPARILDGVINIQNVWLETVDELFQVFGVHHPRVYDLTKSGYLLELVDTRNKIAHGRESPTVAGSLKRSAELDKLYGAIRSQAFYMLDCFNECVKTRGFAAA